LAGVLDWRGFLFRAGAGIFVYDVPSEVIVSVLEKDGMHLKEFRNFGVPLIPTGTSPSVTLPQVRVRVSPDVTRPADLLAAASVQRRLRHVSPAAEYTWTRGRHLLGSRRLPDGSGWSDVLESNRSAERHRLRTRLAFTWKAQTFTAQYEWLRSRDDVDGPFSFPEHQEDLRSEWAFSSAIPRHVFTLVGNLRFPGAVSVTLTDTWRGPAPYNITTGMDLAGNALYNDRGGRARNTGQGPPYQSLSLFAHRRIVLPNLLAGPPRTICLDLGVHLDNLLGHRNLLNVGPIAGSGTFGLPLAGLPGRSVRLSFSFN